MGPITMWATASTASLAIMTGLYLDKRDDYAAQVDACNASKLVAIAEAEKITRETLEAAAARKLAALERQRDSADRAREAAELAAREASERPERVRTVIREVASANACLSTAMPVELLHSLRHD